MLDVLTYGNALYEAAAEGGADDKILQDFDMLSELFSQNPQYIRILNSPVIPLKERYKMLDEDFNGKIHTYLVNFLKLLSEKRGLKEFADCHREYKRCYMQNHKIKTVDVITARPLLDSLSERLRSKLEEKTGCAVQIRNIVDTECIGGIIIKTDDMNIDASISKEIKKLRASLIE